MLDKLHQFKEIGINLSIDDFGTGYSSFSYITQIPLTSLKIDKMFVDNLELNGKIIKSIVKMAHELNLKVVAEGVETKEQYDFLCSISCDKIQGYYLSMPLDTAKMEQLLYYYSKQKRI